MHKPIKYLFLISIVVSIGLSSIFIVPTYPVMAQTNRCIGINIERQAPYNEIIEEYITPVFGIHHYFYVEEGEVVRIDAIATTKMRANISLPNTENIVIGLNFGFTWLDFDANGGSTAFLARETGYYCMYFSSQERIQPDRSPYGFQLTKLQPDRNGILTPLEGLSAYGMNEVGHYYYDINRYDIAAQFYAESLAMAEDAVVLGNLGESLLYLGQLDRAKETLQQAVRMDARNTDFRDFLARIAMLEQDYEEAYRLYNRIATGDTLYYFWRGVSQIGRGNLPAAQRDFELDNSALSFMFLGYIAYQNNNTSLYNQHKTSAFNLAEPQSLIHNRLLTFFALIEGDIDQAMRHYADVLSDNHLFAYRTSDIIYLSLFAERQPTHYSDFLAWVIDQIAYLP